MARNQREDREASEGIVQPEAQDGEQSESIVVSTPDRSGDTGTERRQPRAAASDTQAADGAKARTRRKAPAKTSAQKRREAEQAAGELASLLVEAVNMGVSAAMGPEAAMNPLERGLIEPSLGNILARTSDQALARFLGMTDVVMLGGGLALWLVRVRASNRAPREEVEESQPLAEREPLPGITVSPLSSAEWQEVVQGVASKAASS